MTGQINVNKIVARSGNLITYDSADVVNITLAKGENTASTNLKQGLAKEWTLFDQAGNIHGANTIGDSFNVSSIADNATGRATPTYTNNMSSTSYAIGGNCQGNGIITLSSGGPNTDNFLCISVSNGGSDVDYNHVGPSVQGDLA